MCPAAEREGGRSPLCSLRVPDAVVCPSFVQQTSSLCRLAHAATLLAQPADLRRIAVRVCGVDIFSNLKLSSWERSDVIPHRQLDSRTSTVCNLGCPSRCLLLPPQIPLTYVISSHLLRRPYVPFTIAGRVSLATSSLHRFLLSRCGHDDAKKILRPRTPQSRRRQTPGLRTERLVSPLREP